jgi:hypothetical protein
MLAVDYAANIPAFTCKSYTYLVSAFYSVSVQDWLVVAFAINLFPGASFDALLYGFG